MNPYAIAASILAALIVAGGIGVYLFTLHTNSDAPSGTFEARITLRNTCDIGDDYFVVRAVPSGQIARFRSGEAVMRLTSTDRLRLEIAPGFPEVAYTGYDERARPQVELVADCNSSDRQQMINRAMRDSFGTR